VGKAGPSGVRWGMRKVPRRRAGGRRQAEGCVDCW